MSAMWPLIYHSQECAVLVADGNTIVFFYLYHNNNLNILVAWCLHAAPIIPWHNVSKYRAPYDMRGTKTRYRVHELRICSFDLLICSLG